MLSPYYASDVFIDTDLVVNAVIGGLRNSDACRSAFQESVSSGRSVYYSQVLHVEYMQAIRRLATRNQLPINLYTNFELHRWQERSVRERWMNFGFAELTLFLNELPAVFEIPLQGVVLRRALDLMVEYSMNSLDAVHLATALHYEIPVFWTCDDHFQRVDDLFVEIIRDPA